jgi:hypothetical protein
MVAFKVIVVGVFATDCRDALNPYPTQNKAFQKIGTNILLAIFFKMAKSTCVFFWFHGSENLTSFLEKLLDFFIGF